MIDNMDPIIQKPEARSEESEVRSQKSEVRDFLKKHFNLP